ncbi:hypothetical protein HY990_01305 [Candidatus Micrarchaeota archaeon]|nr:hypothetical protein [Candidatus Micrarchaeota archaeon]
MEIHDEIILTGEYKSLKLGFRFDLSGTKPSDVSYALGQTYSKIELPAYQFAAVDLKKISSFVSSNVSGTGISAVCSFFEKNSPGQIKTLLVSSVPSDKPKLISMAESFMIRELLQKCNVPYLGFSASSSLKPQPVPNDDVIGFIGKFGPWVSIKKLGLEGAQEYEISGVLSGISHSVVNKAFDFSDVKSAETLATAATKGKRKSYGALCEALKILSPNLKNDSASAFAVFKTLVLLNLLPYPSPALLTDAYPDIKPPKVKGRKPKA